MLSRTKISATTSRKGNLQTGVPSTPGFGVMGWSAGLPQFSRLQAARARCFVLLDIEDGVELRDLQQVVYFFGEVEQLEFAALVFASGEGADELADTGAVDIIHVAEVQQDFF